MFFSLRTESELQNCDYDFDAVKEENDVKVVGDDGKAGGTDHMYMKVNFLWGLFHNHQFLWCFIPYNS